MKFTIYCSAPMKYIQEYFHLKNALQESYLDDLFELRIPNLIDSSHYALVDADLFALQKTDILICHIPEPSVGSCAELGYFKALKPNNPIIAYKCIDHPWIKRLANYHCTSLDEVMEILETIVQAY